MVKQKRESANSKTSHLKLCSQKQKEKRMKIKESLRDIWDTIKQTSTCPFCEFQKKKRGRGRKLI